jgi:2-C-methyl-D-erythritol 4-phosphate cytidylyltransferase
MDYTALIVAGGKGKRMGLGYNKVFFQLSEDMTVLEKTISIFEADTRCKEIVVVVSANEYSRCIAKYQVGHVVFVSGGDSRGNSVFNGLMAVKHSKVLIHDGARPYLKQSLLDRIVDKASTCNAVIPCVSVKDTIKEVIDGEVVKTLVRANLKQVQTPQAFNTDLIINCYRQAMERNLEFTDDAQLVELLSDEKIYVVDGDYENIKITTLDDLPRR